jgi:RHS repeat-associated protein
MSLRSWALGLALVSLSFASLPVHADSLPMQEQNRLQRPSDTIGATGNMLFGEQVDMYTGQTEFGATDISIPGNSALPVHLGRRLTISESDRYGHIGGFGNWDLDVPTITGNFGVAGWVVSNNASPNRCSVPQVPLNATDVDLQVAQPPTENDYMPLGQYYVYPSGDFWHGYHMYVPGSGSQELLVNTSASPHPTDGTTYHWVTKSNWVLSCVSSLQADNSGLGGEGFVATSPDGTRYTFNRLVRQHTINADLRVLSGYQYGGTPVYAWLNRYKYTMFATRIDDRFGNWVTYTYDSNNHLTQIAANDGRTITLTYNANGHIATASDGTHTWSYQYAQNSIYTTGESTTEVLSGVTLPDSSAWSFTYGGNLFLHQLTSPHGSDDGYSCADGPQNDGGAGYFDVTATHPSGATGVFHFLPLLYGRSYVPPSNCGTGGYLYPKDYLQFALNTKTLSGPGLSNLVWNYAYSPDASSFTTDTCTPSPCSSTQWTDVTNPDNTRVRRIFGNKFQATEGQLQETTTYDTNSNVLEDETTTYVGDPTGQPYPANVGISPDDRSNIFLSQTLHPVVTTAKTRDGVTFTNTNNTFNAYANPVSQTSSSSLGSSRTDTTSFADNTNAWVIQQVQSQVNSDTGVHVIDNTYDPTTALLTSVSNYGLLDGNYTWYTTDDAQHQAGNLHTATDGNNHTTTFASYYRGIPQSLTFADNTSKSAVVDGLGHLTSLTDEMGYTTGFGYDTMGRLASITPPTGDSVAWTPTNISFAQINSAEYGLPTGHWKQTITTGNATKVNYLDAFWQPVLSQEYDAANQAGTKRFTSKAFDYAGRASFGSYPVASITNYNDTINGVHTTYDGLGRTTASTQDSELGSLTTNYAYLTGFQTQVTNPRGFATTTSFQVFGSPDTSHPSQIVSPLGVTTTISRDVFGKPLTLTRSGTWNGSPISETRSYVYDTNQRLCKRIEPETGASLMDYDAAQNIAWTVTGSTLTTNTCDRASVPTAAKTTRTYDARNRVLTVTIPNSTNLGYSYFNDGALQTLTSGTNSWTYTYNKLRKPVTEQLAIDSRSKTITHTYNALAQESQLTYPDGLVVATNPNALGQPTQAGSYASSIAYFANGGMSGFTYGNGIVHSLTQNTRELPLRSLDQKPGSSAILDDTYTYDTNGNVAGIADGTTGNPNNRTMTYDGLDRLIATSAPHQWWISASTSFDALDNIRQNVLGNRTYNYAYNGNWQLSQLTRPDNSVAYTLGYDAFGNVTSKGSGNDSYTFDAANRMQAVTGKESYIYDGYGRRVKVTRTSDGKTDYPIYTMGGQLLTEDDQRSGNTTDYVSLNGSLVAKRAAPIGTTTWTTTYEHTDALRSPITETNASAQASRIERYTPWGEPGDNQYVQGPGYTGHVTDALTGLTYAQQRYYDPVIGAFLSVDPMVVDSTTAWNFCRYCYAGDNPYKFTDPDGRKLEIDPNASQQFKKETKIQLKELKATPTGKQIIKDLVKSKFTYTLKENVGSSHADPTNLVDAQNGKGTGGTISHDPNWTPSVTTAQGQVATPSAIVLGHELSHAVDYSKGTLDRSVDPATGVRRSEEKAMQVENKIRVEMKQPERTVY